MIEITDLSKSFGAQVVLEGVTLVIESGKTTAVVGPSGTGKSVLLKIITGLLEADGGQVVIDGRCITSAASGAERREICGKMGVLFQGAALFDSMSLLENVAFPLIQRGLCARAEAAERAFDRLEQVGLADAVLRYPGEVSMGMRKRAGIARALVTDPETLLFDEPNTGLDPEVGQEIYELIAETQRLSGFTGIVISHEIPEVFQVCDRVAMLYQGKVQHEGSVKSFLESTNPVVRQFIRGDIEGPIEMC